MPKIYCASCGQPNDYSLQKPNFCGFCSVAIGSAIAAPIPHQPTRRNAPIRPSRSAPRRQPVYEDDEEDFTPLPAIAKLELEVEVQKPVFEKFNEVIVSQPMGGFERPLTKGKVNKKDALAEFQRKIGTKTVISIGDNNAGSEE